MPVKRRVGARLDSGPDGVVNGMSRRGGWLELRYLDQDVVPAPGELVLTTENAELRTARVPGGLIVGMTSVGSGSLIIIALLALYPALSAASLVGTDLVQAVPLVTSAALGHLLFGDFRLDLTAALLIGPLPGVYLGARLSSRAPGGLVRRALALVLLASGLILLGVAHIAMLIVLAVIVVVGPVLWALARTRHGLPARARFVTRGSLAPHTVAAPSHPVAPTVTDEARRDTPVTNG